MKKIFFITFTLLSLTSFAQMTSEQIDELASKTLKSFNVPGISIGIVKDGKIVHAKGYGVRSLNTNLPTDENTLFGIASNSKAFTCTAIAMLVDEGKIKWDDKVTQYLPNFKMYNSYVTKEFTIKDLVTHRSGLGLGSGDLMLWPDGTNFTPAEIVNGIQYLKPTTSYRNNFEYNNVLYLTASEVVAKVSGMSWANFVQEKIINPAGMSNTVSYVGNLKTDANVIDPHVPVDGKLNIIPRYNNHGFDGAAGIYSSATDMCKWAILWMNNMKLSADKKLISDAQQREILQQQTVLPANTKAPYNTHFSGYGLGFFLSDVKGYKQVSHTGGLEGNVTQFIMIPEIGLGIVVLTNQQSGGAFNAISSTIKDTYLGIEPKDYIKIYSDREAEALKEHEKVTSEAYSIAKETFNFPYIGTYKDKWFGTVTLYTENGKYYFKASRSSNLKGQILSYKDNKFIVKWNVRTLIADAFMTFENKGNKMTMKAISDFTDFSYDFHDLEFKKEIIKRGKK